MRKIKVNQNGNLASRCPYNDKTVTADDCTYCVHCLEKNTFYGETKFIICRAAGIEGYTRKK